MFFIRVWNVFYFEKIHFYMHEYLFHIQNTSNIQMIAEDLSWLIMVLGFDWGAHNDETFKNSVLTPNFID